MTIRAIRPGDVLLARKSADQAVSLSVAMADDTDLQFNIEANLSYRFIGRVVFNLAGLVSGYQFDLSGPAAPTSLLYTLTTANGLTGGLLLNAVNTALGVASAGALAVIGNHVMDVNGVIENGANAGALKLRFTQNVSDVGAITVKRGSWFRLERC